MARTSLKRLLLGATTLGFSLSASVAAYAAEATDQKINDPRDHSRAVNCVQSTHTGQKRYAEELGTLAAFGCATQDNDPDRAEDDSTVILSATGSNGSGSGDDDDDGDDGDDGGGGTPESQASSLVYGGAANLPQDDEGNPEMDSLASVVVGTADPDNANRPALLDVRVGDGLIDNGEGEPGSLDITVLDAINGDGDSEGTTGTPLDGVLNIGADTPPGGITPPENIDGIAEVNLGTDPDPAGFNVVQVDAVNDELASIGHVTVGDGLLDEGGTLQDGDLGTELIGIDLGEDPTGNENDNLAQVTLDNENFGALRDGLGIDYVDVVNPPADGAEPGLGTIAEIDGNPDGALAPLVDLFRPVTGPAPEPGEPPVILSSSLVFAGVGDMPRDDEGTYIMDSVASVTVGTADPEDHPGNPAPIDVRVGDGLIDGGEGQEGYVNLTLVDTINGDADGATGTPLDGVLGINADTPPASVTPPEHIDGIAEVNLGTDPEEDGFNVVQANVTNDETLALGHVTVGDGLLDEGGSLQDGDLGSELVGIDLGEDPTGNENDNVAQVTLDNDNFATLGDALGIRAVDVISPPVEGAEPGLTTLLEINGPVEGGLAPLVDLFRPVTDVPDDGGEPEPLGPSSSLAYANLNSPQLREETGRDRFEGLASVTIGTADPERTHPGDDNALDLRVGDGVIGDGASGPGSVTLGLLEVSDDPDATPVLDNLIQLDNETPPSGVTQPETIGSVVQATLGPRENDGDFDVVDADLRNGLTGGLGHALGLNRADAISVPAGTPGPQNLLVLDGALDGALAPLVDVFRPAATETPEAPETPDESVSTASASMEPSVSDMPDVNELPGISSIVSSLPTELQGARTADAGQILRSVDKVLGGQGASGGAADPTTLLEDTLGGVLGLLR